MVDDYSIIFSKKKLHVPFDLVPFDFQEIFYSSPSPKKFSNDIFKNF